MAEKILLATSFVPGHQIPNQQAACRSWLEAGFDVMAVNTAEEVEQLMPHFPNVTFVAAQRDARDLYGKPFIFLHDIFAALLATRRKVVGLVNSDIHLRNVPPGFTDFIADNVSGSTIYAPRYDVDTLEDNQGCLSPGFDLFFFDPRVLVSLPDCGFCIGRSTFDWALPYLTVQHGFQAKKLINAVVFHVRHAGPRSKDEVITMSQGMSRLYGNLDTWARIALSLPAQLYFPANVQSSTAPVLALVPEGGLHPQTMENLCADSRIMLAPSSLNASDRACITARYDYVYEPARDAVYCQTFVTAMVDQMITHKSTSLCCAMELHREWELAYHYLNGESMQAASPAIKSACTLYDPRRKGEDIHFSDLPLVRFPFLTFVRAALECYSNESVYLYAFSGDTQNILRSLGPDFPYIKGIIDQNPALHGTNFLHYPIIGPDEAYARNDIDRIIIGTYFYEREAFEQLRLRIPEEKLIRLYHL